MFVCPRQLWRKEISHRSDKHECVDIINKYPHPHFYNTYINIPNKHFEIRECSRYTNPLNKHYFSIITAHTQTFMTKIPTLIITPLHKHSQQTFTDSLLHRHYKQSQHTITFLLLQHIRKYSQQTFTRSLSQQLHKYSQETFASSFFQQLYKHSQQHIHILKHSQQ